MKIPLEWLKNYIKLDKSPKQLAESFTSLGLMLDKPTDGKVLDLEHRMDRSDWLSIIGCARDLAAFEKVPLIYPPINSKKGKTPSKGQLVEIKVECPKVINRFNTRVFRGIKVKESPEWLKTRLTEYGIQSINNIVDITNYVMVELGQPMHAQDLSKFEIQEIVIRLAKEGEQITTFLGETITLDSDTFVLTQNNKPIVIGGIVGGRDTGVSETTTDIILDAGNYNQTHVRKTSRRLKIQNETVLRYDKFLHPNLTELALERATYLINELAGGEYYENVDWYPNKVPLKMMQIRTSRIELLSGMTFNIEDVEKTLVALEYRVLNKTSDSLEVEVPYFRTDVEVEDDLVADILRIGNYKNIPITQINLAPPKEITPQIYKFEEKLKDIMVSLGGHEHITDPVVKANPQKKHQVVLENALNADKSALRTTMYETLVPIVETYVKHRGVEATLFEIGKVYSRDGDKNSFKSYKETRVLEVIYLNRNETNAKGEMLSLKDVNNGLKSILSGLLLAIGITKHDFTQKRVGDKSVKELVDIMGPNNIKLGELSVDSLTLYTEALMQASSRTKRVSYDIPNERFEDFSIEVSKDTAIGELIKDIENLSKDIINAYVTEEDVVTTENEKKKILIRIRFQNEIDRDALLKIFNKY